MGACASCGGVFNNYAIVQGVDKIMPVDIFVPGCPPTPDMLLYGLNLLQEKIRLRIPNPVDPMKTSAVKDLGSERLSVKKVSFLWPKPQTTWQQKRWKRYGQSLARPYWTWPSIAAKPASGFRPKKSPAVAKFLRDHPVLRYNFLADLTAVDWPEREPRFDIVYHLLSWRPTPRSA